MNERDLAESALRSVLDLARHYEARRIRAINLALYDARVETDAFKKELDTLVRGTIAEEAVLRLEYRAFVVSGARPAAAPGFRPFSLDSIEVDNLTPPGDQGAAKAPNLTQSRRRRKEKPDDSSAPQQG